MGTLKSVSEVVAKLKDAEFANQYVVKINKGTDDRPRWLDVIEWHTALAMLDEVFGPFGYDLEITGSHSDYTSGLYTVDMKLTGRALDDATGEVVTLVRPGRGLGLVPRSALQSDPEHDRQAHGAKSDAITNATKALGKGFGLHLYFKKNGNGNSTPQRTSSPQSPNISNGNGGGGKDFRPSAKQMAVFNDNGYGEAEVSKMVYGTWKPILDAIFAAGKGNFNRGAYEASLAGGDSTNVDDLPF